MNVTAWAPRFSFDVDGSVLDRCQDVIKVSDSKYQFRTGAQAIAIVYRLVP